MSTSLIPEFVFFKASPARNKAPVPESDWQDAIYKLLVAFHVNVIPIHSLGLLPKPLYHEKQAQLPSHGTLAVPK